MAYMGRQRTTAMRTRLACRSSFLGGEVCPREPSKVLGSRQKALLRSTHWSGRPMNHLAQRDRRLYPRRRVVLASRVQHAAELGYTQSQPAQRHESLRSRALRMIQFVQ
jgi:hypothetical protein